MHLHIKSVGQSFYILTVFIFLILAENIVTYLSFVIMYDKHLKYIAVTGQLLQ